MSTDLLREALLHEVAYPKLMHAVDRGIQGDGFYPGARGYVGDSFPRYGVMLLGRDFGTKDYYDRLVGPRSETAHTWSRTCRFYLQTLKGIPVWCTNYLMGVRVDGPATGNVKPHIPAPDWVRYEESCWRFFLQQFDLQQPKVIAVFGKDNRKDLGLSSRLDSASFAHVRTLYLNHPYSAISEKQQATHIMQAAAIRAAYLKVQN